MITEAQFTAMFPKAGTTWVEPLNKILPKYGINTTARIAGFLSQVGHESGGFTTLEENLNYSAAGLTKTFGKYFKNRDVNAYAKKPEAIANLVYGSRLGNGDEASGDGYRFRGRGLIQLTGRENYTKFGASISKTAEEVIEYIKTPAGAIESACWYWATRSLNKIADAADVEAMSKAVNGGTIGLTERKALYARITSILSAIAPSESKPVTTLSRGSRGPAVAELQESLGLAADGIFGLFTEMSLKAWQQKNGMPQTGSILIADVSKVK